MDTSIEAAATSKNKVLWDAVRKEKTASKAIKLITDISEETENSNARAIATISNGVKEVKKMLNGNGDPAHGVLGRIETIEKDLAESKCNVEEIKTAIIGEVAGTTDKSLSARITHLENSMGIVSKISWAIIALILAELVARILKLI